METKVEIPELTCEGCKNRDRIIMAFAEEMDRRDAVDKEREKAEAHVEAEVAYAS